jgi:peptidoglycan/LPS O-acetylase OafA/YrhL
MPPAARRTDLDLLRIIVCFSVILAHALLVFAAEPNYHVKSAAPWTVATIGYEFMRIATLAIFFVLAGWSAVVSLRRRPSGRYVKDRVARVLLPLAAGIILLGPIIKWIELNQGRDLRITGFRLVPVPEIGFLEFIPRYFGRINLLTWSHLWFLAYLFLISLALLPLLLRLARRAPSAEVPSRLLAYAPAAALAGYMALSGGYWPFLPNLLQDWANLGYFALLFAGGAALAAWPGYEARLRAEAPRLAILALAGLLIVVGAGEGTLGRLGVGLCAWGRSAPPSASPAAIRRPPPR